MVFTRHLYYVDWAQYGCDIMYFNLVRTFIICRYYDKWRNGLFGKGLSLIYICKPTEFHFEDARSG